MKTLETGGLTRLGNAPMEGSPVWFVFWPTPGPPARYVARASAHQAMRAVRELGLPRPAGVHFAGYNAFPCEAEDLFESLGTVEDDQAPARRAEAALTVYGLLRVDWPIGSLMSEDQARGRITAAALRDFIANMGRAIARLEASPHTLLNVVDSHSRALWWRSIELGARRRRNERLEATARERRQMYRKRVRRLRRRIEYAAAVEELDAALTGRLDRDQVAVEEFRRNLVVAGLTDDDAETFARRFARIPIPRL